jgi:glycosyltransferase involved in cell wall biosynthesis
MNVWLIHPGELLPIDGNVRLYRYGILAEKLISQGHQVVRWAPTLVHATKTFRCHANKTEWPSPNYRIELLHAGGYRHHIGFRRYFFYQRLAQQFRQQAERLAAPDVILCAMPDPDLCHAATDYGTRHSVPVIIDVRDLWPDAALDNLPPWTRKPIEWLLTPIFAKNRRAFRAAAGVIGISPGFRDWGLQHACRAAGPRDGVFYMAASPPEFTTESREQSLRTWSTQRVGDDNRFRCSFLAMIGSLYDLETPLRAARHFQDSGDLEPQFVICGDGPKLKQLRDQAHGLRNVVIPGWIQPVEVQTLMELSDIAMIPYRRGASTSLPNKAVTYFSAGLPVVSTAGGEFASIVDEHQCGLTYEPENVEDFIRAFNRLRQDPLLRKKFSDNSREFYARELQADRVFDNLIRFLVNVSRKPLRQAA